MVMKLNIKKIENLRKAKKMSKSSFAKRIGYKTAAGYSNLLRFAYVPREATLNKIIKTLNCPKADLIKMK